MDLTDIPAAPRRGRQGPSPEMRADRALARQLPRAWSAFFEHFGRLTTVQRAAMPTILDGRDVLVCAATAAGKTEAACAPLVERHVGRAEPWTVLYVSPTRALVNDLHARLSVPLARLGLRCDRRTGDHRASTERLPHVLLTTPESFDSLLCRGRRGPGGHALGQVVAVVLDEIHLLHGTARGEQIRWLLERLRRLHRETATDGRRVRRVQIIALSATVPDQDAVLAAYVPNGVIVAVPGGREIEVVAPDCDDAATESALPAYLRACSSPEKVLVFGNSRRRVDDLAAGLRVSLHPLGYRVRAHHGSLARREREEAEADAQVERRLVLVATSTLEIGIDIGDVDLVVLDGPPPDVPALLQRIGRGNRRSGSTRVMACAATPGEALIQSAMIEAAREGWLGPAEHGPQHAVARQQLASIIFQGARVATSREELQALLDVCAAPIVARTLLADLIASGEFVEDASGVRLGADWLEQMGQGAIHSNIEDAPGATVRDELTGREIVSGISSHDGRGLRAGGQFLKIQRWGAFSIEVKRVASAMLADGEWRYITRPRFRGAGQPQAVRRFLGLPEDVWPVISRSDGVYAFHFGGERCRSIIELAASQATASSAGMSANAWYLRLPVGSGRPRWLAEAGPATLSLALADRLETFERLLGRPTANRELPPNVRLDEILGWLQIGEGLARCQAARWVTASDPEIAAVLQLLLADLMQPSRR